MPRHGCTSRGCGYHPRVPRLHQAPARTGPANVLAVLGVASAWLIVSAPPAHACSFPLPSPELQLQVMPISVDGEMVTMQVESVNRSGEPRTPPLRPLPERGSTIVVGYPAEDAKMIRVGVSYRVQHRDFSVDYPEEVEYEWRSTALAYLPAPQPLPFLDREFEMCGSPGWHAARTTNVDGSSIEPLPSRAVRVTWALRWVVLFVVIVPGVALYLVSRLLRRMWRSLRPARPTAP